MDESIFAIPTVSVADVPAVFASSHSLTPRCFVTLFYFVLKTLALRTSSHNFFERGYSFTMVDILKEIATTLHGCEVGCWVFECYVGELFGKDDDYREDVDNWLSEDDDDKDDDGVLLMKEFEQNLIETNYYVLMLEERRNYRGKSTKMNLIYSNKKDGLNYRHTFDSFFLDGWSC